MKTPPKRNKIDVDTLELGLYTSDVKIPTDIESNGYALGLKYNIYDSLAYFKISSKGFARPNNIGSITVKNYKDIPKFIYDNTGIKVNEDVLLNNTNPYAVHVKSDIHVDDGDTSSYISIHRELFKRKTDKYDVYKYKDLKYSDGLQVIPKEVENTGLAVVPKASTKNNRFIIYKKGTELNKYENKEFRELFDKNYLKQLNQVIRFEYHMRTFEDMRKAFNVEEPTLENIFNSDANPVYEFYLQLLNDSEKEVEDEEIDIDN